MWAQKIVSYGTRDIQEHLSYRRRLTMRSNPVDNKCYIKASEDAIRQSSANIARHI